MLRRCALVLTVGLAVVGLAQADTNPDDGTAAQAVFRSHPMQTHLATPSRDDPHTLNSRPANPGMLRGHIHASCQPLTTCLVAVTALRSLQACVANNAANLAYVNGWNTSSGATPSAPGAADVTAALAAAGVPGVTAGQTPSAPGTDSSDPCATVPWTGLLCTGDRVTTM